MNANTRYSIGRVRCDADPHVWAIVLAGGAGTRLRALTCDAAGASTPKQYCSFNGGASLLEQALARACSVVAAERVFAVVAAAHSRYWQSPLSNLPPRNVIVQSLSRGVGVGLLAPALAIFNRDPHARILVLPSDHFVEDETTLASAMRTALAELEHAECGIALLGAHAEEPDPEFGYVLSGARLGRALRTVRRFVEKPTLAEASALCEAGALWNMFIMACRVRSLIDLYYARYPQMVQRLIKVDPFDEDALAHAYARLPHIDFSNDVAAGCEAKLASMLVPPCGWSDLGTVLRVAQTLLHRPAHVMNALARSSATGMHVNLALRLIQRYPQYLTYLPFDASGGAAPDAPATPARAPVDSRDAPDRAPLSSS